MATQQCWEPAREEQQAAAELRGAPWALSCWVQPLWTDGQLKKERCCCSAAGLLAVCTQARSPGPRARSGRGCDRPVCPQAISSTSLPAGVTRAAALVLHAPRQPASATARKEDAPGDNLRAPQDFGGHNCPARGGSGPTLASPPSSSSPTPTTRSSWPSSLRRMAARSPPTSWPSTLDGGPFLLPLGTKIGSVKYERHRVHLNRKSRGRARPRRTVLSFARTQVL